uniref:Putative licpodalin-4 1 n=1 Tax=Amblyomma triste TaxID=251400 RepID=A0A023GB78_AMBTT
MVIFFFLGLSCLFSASTGQPTSSSRDGQLYEEDELHFSEQKIQEVLELEGRAFVIKRNFRTETPHRCHSVKVTEKIDDTTYTVSLGAAPSVQQRRSFIIVMNSTVNLLKTGSHQEYNAANYIYWHGLRSEVRKLLHVNADKTCFIMVENRHSSSQPAACQLLMPENTIDGFVPADCNDIYEQNCPGESVVVLFIDVITVSWYKAINEQNCPGESVVLYQEYCKDLPYLSFETALAAANGSPDAVEQGLFSLASAL